MRTIHREITAVMIFSKDGKLLMAQKNAFGKGAYIGKWHIPGGGLEGNETKEVAIIRELQEDLDLDISSYKVEMIDDEGKGSSQRVIKGEYLIVEMDFSLIRKPLLTN